jgi:LPXTG-site transpeptidase (sortase) family protein
MYTNTKDPLTHYESLQEERGFLRSFQRTCSYVISYLLLSGSIFLVLLVSLNYSAYSGRIINWVNPDALIEARDEVNKLLASATSVSVHASEESLSESRDNLESVTSKILASDPSIIYSRDYVPEWLIANIGEKDQSTTFAITPYENRIIIPRIGENIPLVDVEMDNDLDFATMHEVFMEELRKWVVRYPGTAEPGAEGNVFIFGHSSNYPWVKSQYNSVFALIDQLEKGDEIIIYYFQKKYVYKVTDHAIVKPGDVKTLESRDQTKKELSLMTCWPIGTTLERIIVFAELDEANSTK